MQNRGAVHLGHSFCVERPSKPALRRYQNLGVVGVAPRQQPARERRQHLLGGAVQVERRERVGARRAVVEERDGRAALGDGAHEAERAVHLDRAADDEQRVGAREIQTASRLRCLLLFSCAELVNIAKHGGSHQLRAWSRASELRAYCDSHHASVQHFTCRSFF